MRTVTLYTKPNCPLCDKALEQIELAQAELARTKTSFTFEQVNILSDLALYECYKHDIPVICLDGVEIFRHRLTAPDLLAKL